MRLNLLWLIMFFAVGNSCNEDYEADGRVKILDSTSVINTSRTDFVTAVLKELHLPDSAVKTEVLKDLAPGEIRKISPENTGYQIAEISSSVYTHLNESLKTKVPTIFITGFITILASICFYYYSNNRKSKHEIAILISEIQDVRRHYKANLDWLNEMKLEKGIPMDFYIQRLKSWDSLILNSQETYRTIPGRHTPHLAHVRLVVRNNNIEIEDFLNYLRSDNYNVTVGKQHLAFLISKTKYLRARLEIIIFLLSENFEKKTKKEYLQELEDLKEEQKGEIIYKTNMAKAQPGNLRLITRDSEEISLANYIQMPPTGNKADAGLNILHINTRNSHYSQNMSAKQFIDDITATNDNLRKFPNDSSTLKYAVEEAMRINTNGLFLEFGFCSGNTLNFIAALAYDRKVFGFDSLKGLPATWRAGFPANVFAYKNEQKFPFIPLSNTSLVIGWIDDTLPLFIQEHLSGGHVAFLHIDSDTFAAAESVLTQLKSYILPAKTIVVLDEGYNFSDPLSDAKDAEWKKHEYSAVQNFATTNNYNIRYLAYNENHQQLVLTFISRD